MARIGLVGFFGWGNYGDELFHRLWERRLSEYHHVTSVAEIHERPYFTRPVTEIAAEHDAFVIGGGDLVIPTYISPLYWNSAWLSKPVYIAGVGVPTWVGNGRPDVVERMADFFQHKNVRCISARDAESAEWIRRVLRPNVPVTVHADLVFALPVPPPKQYERPTVGLSLRAQRTGGADTAAIERTMRRIADDGFDVVRIVLGTGEIRKRDAEVARSLDVPGEIIESENLDEITSAIGGLHALFSAKFHGTVVATAYGVPTVVVIGTTKTQNLYRRLDRLALLSRPDDDAMYDKFQLCNLRVPRLVREHLAHDAESGVRELLERLNNEVRPAAR